MPVRTLAQAAAYTASRAAATATTDTTPRVGDVICAIAFNDIFTGPPAISGGSGWTVRGNLVQNDPDLDGVGVDAVVATRVATTNGAQSITATNPDIDSGVFLLVAVLSDVAEAPAAVLFAGIVKAADTISAPSVTGVRGGGTLLNAAGTSYTTNTGQAITAPSSATSSIVTATYDTALARLAVDGSPPAARAASGPRTFALSPVDAAAAVSVLFEPLPAVVPSTRAGQMFLGA